MCPLGLVLLRDTSARSRRYHRRAGRNCKASQRKNLVLRSVAISSRLRVLKRFNTEELKMSPDEVTFKEGRRRVPVKFYGKLPTGLGSRLE